MLTLLPPSTVSSAIMHVTKFLLVIPAMTAIASPVITVTKVTGK